MKINYETFDVDEDDYDDVDDIFQIQNSKFEDKSQIWVACRLKRKIINSSAISKAAKKNIWENKHLNNVEWSLWMCWLTFVHNYCEGRWLEEK